MAWRGIKERARRRSCAVIAGVEGGFARIISRSAARPTNRLTLPPSLDTGIRDARSSPGAVPVQSGQPCRRVYTERGKAAKPWNLRYLASNANSREDNSLLHSLSDLLDFPISKGGTKLNFNSSKLEFATLVCFRYGAREREIRRRILMVFLKWWLIKIWWKKIFLYL